MKKNVLDKELKDRGIDPLKGDREESDRRTTSIEQQKKQITLDRRERLKDATRNFSINTATMPIYTRLLEDAARRRLES